MLSVLDKKKSLNICFLELLEEFCRTEKRVRIIHGKRAIRVRAFEVILYGSNSLASYRFVRAIGDRPGHSQISFFSGRDTVDLIFFFFFFFFFCFQVFDICTTVDCTDYANNTIS